MISIKVNGEIHQFDVDPSTPLLWVIRENAKLTGSKFGCGMGLCGACTVHIDGKPMRSCVTPVAYAQEKEVTTIEGIGNPGTGLHYIQKAWIEEQVPQCGYCQSGQIMSAVALIDNNPNPSDEDIENAMDGNICRCGMYNRIRSGIKRAVELKKLDNAKIFENG
jgi:isoquinoline 1-oxidoreductase alpha subunit